VSLRAPLIGAAALAALPDPPVVLDIRWTLGGPPGREEYLRGHIPGAVYVDLDTELAGAPGPRGRHPLPDGEAFGATMRAAGVSENRGVVVYDAGTSMAAARAWWLLRYFGHAHVAVLDGGLAAWVETHHPLQTAVPKAQSGDFVPRPGGVPVLEAREAARIARDGVLLDARARERFLGETEPIDAVAGHIPGARSRPTTDNIGADGRFRSPELLRSEFEQLGIRDDVEVGTYCGSGVTAAHEALALELAGFTAALYAGSWSEWISAPERPVATG
jgi:thiosulfate/3-mercaptopyruvate sulfurtransferase